MTTDLRETTGDGGSGGDGGIPVMPVPMCVATCRNAADCSQPSPLYSDGHWSCNAGLCKWNGCKTDNECMTAYSNGFMICRAMGSEPPNCVATCHNAADCSQPSPLYSDGHWSCNTGLCKWNGCKTDNECMAAYSNGFMICRAIGSEPPNCVATCHNATDCSQPSPLYSDGHWSCNAGFCKWNGCKTDNECAVAYMNSYEVCHR